MARKGKKDKRKKGKEPESSTPETSTNSVDDDTQQLLRSGAGASTGGRKSKADEKTKKDSRWPPQRNPSSYQSSDATSSRNSAQCGSSADPDPESSTTPSKKSSLSPLRKILDKVSKNHSPGTEYNCEDGNHQPVRPNPTYLSVDPKGAFGGARPKTYNAKKDEDGTKSSSSFGEISGKTSRAQKGDSTQSSSSSDPSYAECLASASESQQSSEKSLLLDPNRGAEVTSTGPSKKITHATRMRDKSETKRRENRSSGTESSFEDKTNEELKCPEQRKPKVDPRKKSPKGKLPNKKQTTSKTTSSSGSSTSTKNENSDSSYILPRIFNPKSSTKSHPKGKHPWKGPLGNKKLLVSEGNTEASGISTDSDPFDKYFNPPTTEEKTQPQATGGKDLENQDEILVDLMDVERRGRIQSRGLISHLPETNLRIPSDPNSRQYNFREMNVQIEEIERKRLEEEKRKAQEAKNETREEKDGKKKKDSAANALDENERELRKEVERAKPTRSASRKKRDSSSPVRVRPCNCGADQGRRMGHDISCAQQGDLSRINRKKKNRFA